MNVQFIKAAYFTPGRYFQKVDTIVIHWIDGTLATADKVFSGNTDRMVSSHFAVEDEQVHQYVKLTDTAWQAGNWLVNLRSVGIEHSAQPGRNATDTTYETSSQLIVQICRQLGLTPSRSLLKKHSEIVPDECPGTIDLDRLARRAVEIWNGTVRVPVTTGADQPIASNPIPATLADAPIHHFQPFLTNLAPSQTFIEEVGRVQDYLVWKGYMDGPGPYRGYFGPKTQAAIDKFQKAHGISAAAAYYGWWYDRTRAAANSEL